MRTVAVAGGVVGAVAGNALYNADWDGAGQWAGGAMDGAGQWAGGAMDDAGQFAGDMYVDLYLHTHKDRTLERTSMPILFFLGNGAS